MATTAGKQSDGNHAYNFVLPEGNHEDGGREGVVLSPVSAVRNAIQIRYPFWEVVFTVVFG